MSMAMHVSAAVPSDPRFVWLREPWKHQREIWEHAKEQQDYALFWEMGAGKTFETINILRWRYLKAGRIMRTLVICPPIMREAWRREFHQASKVGQFVQVIGGVGKKRALKFTPSLLIGVTNYESLQMKEVYAAIKKWDPEIIVFDEAQRLKNGQAKRTKLAIELADLAKHRYILTGSPILRDAMDIWAQFRVLDGGATFEKNFYVFRAKYFSDKNAGMPKQSYFPNWQLISGVESHFNKLIYAKASRVLKKDCLDLPPLVKKMAFVDLSPKQRAAYDQMKAHFIAYIDSKACVATIALTKALRLQQIVSGHFVDDEGVMHEFEDLPRMAALEEYLDDLVPDHKVVVWAAFRADAERICSLLLDKGIEHRYLVGGMTAKAQQEAIDALQTDPTVRVMVANQQAAGVGITLTAASYAIYYSRNFSLEADLQSEARTHRGGSEIHEKITRIDLVCPETIDETVIQALYRKENLAEAILKIRV